LKSFEAVKKSPPENTLKSFEAVKKSPPENMLREEITT